MSIVIDPKRIPTYLQRADAKSAGGDLDGAIEDCSNALSIDKRSTAAWQKRGSLKHEKRDFAGAAKDFSKAVELEPDNIPAIFGRGFANYENFRFVEAVGDFKRILELDPKHIPATYHMASSHGFMKKQAEAVDWYDKLLKLSPDYLPGLILRASMKFEIGRYDSAIEDCDRALQREPGHSGATFHKAAALLAKGEWKAAGEHFERVLKDAPKDWDWRERAAAIVALLPELAAEQSKDPLASRLAVKARALMLKKEYGPAIAILEEVLRLDCRSKAGLEAIVVAHHERDNNERGDYRATWDRIFELIDLGQGLSPEVQRIVLRKSSFVLGGLLWLARHQSEDGRWSADAFGESCARNGTPRCEGKGPAGSDLRATSFVLLAFLSAGYSELSKDNYGTKPMGVTIQAGLTWLIKKQNADGSFGDRDSARFLEDHAIAAMAMSEAYGMTSSKTLKESADKAITFLKSAKLAGKGWPKQKAEGGADPEATGWALLALWSGKMSELPGAEADFDEGLGIARKVLLGGKPLEGGLGELLTMAASGCDRKAPSGNELEPRLEKLSQTDPLKLSGVADPTRFYVGTLAMRFGDGEARWKRWKDVTKEVLIKPAPRMGDNLCLAGSWNPDAKEGRLLTTTFNILTLELYYGYRNAFGSLTEKDEDK